MLPAVAEPLHWWSARDLAHAIASREISAVEVMRAHLDRIHEVNPRLNAIVTLLDDEDPAVRFYAIGALERIAGDRKGYDYFDDDPAARGPAVERWRQWLSDEGLGAPAAPPKQR